MGRPSRTAMLANSGRIFNPFSLMIGFLAGLTATSFLQDRWAFLSAAIPPSSAIRNINLGVQKELDAFLPEVSQGIVPQHGKFQYIADNQKVLDRLDECQTQGNCKGNQDKLIIVVGIWCYSAVYEGYNGGEGVWCRSMLSSMRRLGYTSILHVRSGEDWEYAYQLHRAYADDVHLIIGDDIPRAKEYYLSDDRPDGIPAWKHLYFTYFPSAFDNVVGNEWSITGEPYTGRGQMNFSYIGSEVTCNPKTIIPHAQRKHQALILSKRLMYFYGWNPAWEVDWFERATKDLRESYHPDFEFVGTFEDHLTDDDVQMLGYHPEAPKGVRSLGSLSKEEYETLLGESRVLVGIGSPGTSPAPYGSLCHGTPFLNPHRLVADRDPEDRLDWEDVQHSTIRFMDAPYVYQVERMNYTSFVEGIRAAMETPTPMYQFPALTREAVDGRMQEVLERDWYELAKVTLAKRLEGNEDPEQHGQEFML